MEDNRRRRRRPIFDQEHVASIGGLAAVEETCKRLDGDLDAWRELNTKELATFNATLEQHQAAAVPIVSTPATTPGCK